MPSETTHSPLIHLDEHRRSRQPDPPKSGNAEVIELDRFRPIWGWWWHACLECGEVWAELVRNSDRFRPCDCGGKGIPTSPFYGAGE